MNDEELRSAFEDLLQDLPASPVLPASTARRVARRRGLKLGASALGGAGALVTAAVLVLGTTAPSDDRLETPAATPSATPVPSPTLERTASPSPSSIPSPTAATSPAATAPPLQPSPAPATQPRVTLRPDGLGSTGGGSPSSVLPFGADAVTVRAATERALLAGGEMATPDCGSGSSAVQHESLFLLLQGGDLIGWATGSPGLTTAEGIGVGSTLAELREALPAVTVTESTLGPEWSTPAPRGHPERHGRQQRRVEHGRRRPVPRPVRRSADVAAPRRCRPGRPFAGARTALVGPAWPELTRRSWSSAVVTGCLVAGHGAALPSLGMREVAADTASRAAWDAVAENYGRLLPDMSLEAPLDRAVLAAYAEMLADHRAELVAEVGCGTGRVTRHLHEMGVRTVGFDLSPRMVAVARAAHEGSPFAAAHAQALPLRKGALGGLVAWYSLITMPTGSLPAVFAEFARVARSGAPVLVAFQSGDGQRVERSTSYGLPVPLTYYRHRVDEATAALTSAGFTLYASVVRAAALSFESTPQAALLALRR